MEDMLLQVVLHGCYHRGQVALVVRGAGAEPSPTDYIAFVRGAPAAVTPRPVPLASSLSPTRDTRHILAAKRRLGTRPDQRTSLS